MRNITYETFFHFGTSVVIGPLFVFDPVPETEGFTLKEMDILFTRKGPAYTWRMQTEQQIEEYRAQHLVSLLEVVDKNAHVHKESI